MNYVFAKSATGYAHIRKNKPCQDYSSIYQDKERIIVTCCDGHGGPQYIRSHVGSKLASESVINVFKEINEKFFKEGDESALYDKIKLLVLCEYNKLVERQLAASPFRKREMEGLDETQIDTLRFNPSKAYGTTLAGVMLYKNKFIVISIGDTEALGIYKGNIVKLFNNEDDPAGNITYSMCQEDAYKYLRVTIVNASSLDGVLLCTDGLSSPYQSYHNLEESFIKPTVKKLICSKSLTYIDSYIDEVATRLGVGDDVSLAFIIKGKTKAKNYV